MRDWVGRGPIHLAVEGREAIHFPRLLTSHLFGSASVGIKLHLLPEKMDERTTRGQSRSMEASQSDLCMQGSAPTESSSISPVQHSARSTHHSSLLLLVLLLHTISQLTDPMARSSRRRLNVSSLDQHSTHELGARRSPLGLGRAMILLLLYACLVLWTSFHLLELALPYLPSSLRRRALRLVPLLAGRISDSYDSDDDHDEGSSDRTTTFRTTLLGLQISTRRLNALPGRWVGRLRVRSVRAASFVRKGYALGVGWGVIGMMLSVGIMAVEAGGIVRWLWALLLAERREAGPLERLSNIVRRAMEGATLETSAAAAAAATATTAAAAAVAAAATGAQESWIRPLVSVDLSISPSMRPNLSISFSPSPPLPSSQSA